MTIALSPLAGSGWQFLDNSGNVLTYGKLYIYAAGTTTPITTYGNSSGSINNSNPIILDSAGRVPNQIWLTVGTAYKFVLQTSTAVQLGAWDNVSVYPGVGGGSSVTWPVTLDNGNVLREGKAIIEPVVQVGLASYSSISSVAVSPNILTTYQCGATWPLSFSESFDVTKMQLQVRYFDSTLATPFNSVTLRFFTSKFYLLNSIPDTLVGGPYTFSASSASYGGDPEMSEVNTPGLTFVKDTQYWVVLTTLTAGIQYQCGNDVTKLPNRYNRMFTDNSTLGTGGAIYSFWMEELSEANITGLTTLGITPTNNQLQNAFNSNRWAYTATTCPPWMRFFVSQP